MVRIDTVFWPTYFSVTITTFQVCQQNRIKLFAGCAPGLYFMMVCLFTSIVTVYFNSEHDQLLVVNS